MKEKVESSENINKKIIFFDEGRFGTMTTIKRKWSLKGSKCEIKVKQGYSNFYSFSGVCPSTGEMFSLLLPKVNTEMMNLYLEKLSSKFKGEKIVLIMDNAGWHKSKRLKVPKNIEIEYLPPYSPELNPVERLWKWLKENTIHNRIFLNIEELYEAVCMELKKLTCIKIMELCRCNYL